MQLYLHLDDEDNEAYVADVLEDVEEVLNAMEYKSADEFDINPNNEACLNVSAVENANKEQACSSSLGFTSVPPSEDVKDLGSSTKPGSFEELLKKLRKLKIFYWAKICKLKSE